MFVKQFRLNWPMLPQTSTRGQKLILNKFADMLENIGEQYTVYQISTTSSSMLNFNILRLNQVFRR